MLQRSLALFSRHDELSIAELAGHIEQDVVIAGTILGLANSAIYRGHSALSSLRQAIVRLGINKARNVLLGLSVARSLGRIAALILKEYAYQRQKWRTFMPYTRLTASAALLLCAPMLADDVSDRAKLLGTWQQQDNSAKAAAIWVLEMKGMALHITESLGDQKVTEFACPPKGADCEGTVEGKKAVVSMYYDGPALVQFETQGSDVTRRRFTVTGQPDVMEIDVMPIVGVADKAETLHLKRIK